ncbi:MAG: hypothetical protein FWB91_09665 [Defluviitaleaceae bacterium]|nr:hypothetical protein [Defluviitaleaceae bacterium]
MPDDNDKLTDDMDDLEAQLAALGMFSSDDGDGGLSALLSGDDDDPFSMLETMGESGGSDSASASTAMDGDSLDLDAQLEALLNADQSADEDFDIRDMSVSTHTQSVYDPEVEGMGMVQYVKGSFKVEDEKPSTKLFDDISFVKILATAIIGALFILVGAASVIFATSAIRNQQVAVAAVSHFVPIELPTNVANNANFVFISQPMLLGNRSLTLNRISAGYTGTFFFFDELFDPDDYIILLYNQARYLYPITTFNIRPAPGGGTVLQFGSLKRNTLFLTLHIQCRATYEYVRFEYRFLSPPTHSPPLYLTRGVYALGDDGFPGLKVRHAIFDNTSSQIHYSFTHDPRKPGLRMNPGFGDTFVTLNDIFSTINSLTNGLSAVYYEDFNITIGSATFGTLLTIDGPMNVNFNDLTFFYPSPRFDVTPQMLYGNDQSRPFSIQTGMFTLNLEAMQQQGRHLVLTLHGLDENGRRRETIPQMTVRINANGRNFDLPGEARPSPRGTDVLFDLLPYSMYIREAHISQYSLLIHSVEYSIPQISVPLQMSPVFNNLPNARRFMAETAVTEAFLSLLAYKSGDITADGIIGFSDELRNDPQRMNIFSPVNSSRYSSMYGATVVTGDLISNYDYISVVEVQWVAGEGRSIEYFHATFQVTSRSRDGIWAVVDFRQI